MAMALLLPYATDLQKHVKHNGLCESVSKRYELLVACAASISFCTSCV